MINLDHPFFAPAWRRYLTVGVCFVWGVFEAMTGAVFWSVVFVGVAVVAFWRFGQIDWTKYNQGD